MLPVNLPANPPPVQIRHTPFALIFKLPKPIYPYSHNTSNESYSVSQKETFSQKVDRIYQEAQLVVQMAHSADINDFNTYS